MRPATPARGGNAAHAIARRDGHETVGRSDREAFAIGQVNGNVAAIVDIGAVQVCRLLHGLQNFVRHRARHRRHRGDALTPAGLHGLHHAAGHRPVYWQPLRRDPGAQQRQFADQLLQQAFEPGTGRQERPPYLRRFPVGPDDQVDGAVLQVQPLAVGQHGSLDAHAPGSFFARFDQPKCRSSVGHGTPCFEAAPFCPASTWSFWIAFLPARASASGMTCFMWPPSAS